MSDLEEGEAVLECFNFDKLAYLDEKLQNVVGQFQKEFEDGGLFTEGLGAISGQYGTFLPTRLRSPPKVQTQTIVKQPTPLRKEGIGASIATPGTTQIANAVANVPFQRNENATFGRVKAHAISVSFQREGNSSVKAPALDAVAFVPSQRNGNSTVGSSKAPTHTLDAVANVPSQRNANSTVGSAKAPTHTLDAVANVPYSQRNGSATALDAVANVSSQRNGSASCKAKANAPNAVAKRKESATVGSEKAPAKVVSKTPNSLQKVTNKPVIRDDRNLLKFRIKVGSEELLQKNTAIYSGLGLISPSSSTGNSLGDSEGRRTLVVSLASILQMLTSLATGDSLVTPLDDSVRNLKNRMGLLVTPLDDSFRCLKESKSSSTIKLKRNLSSTSVEDSAASARVMKMQKVSRCCDGKALEDEVQLRSKENSGARPSNSIANAKELNLGKAVETSQEYDNGALSSKRVVKSISGQSSGKLDHREPKGLLIHLGKKQAINSQKEMATDHGESARKNSNTNPANFGVAEKGGKGDASQFIPKRTMKAASSEQNKAKTPDTTVKSSSAGIKTLKGAPQRGGALVASKGNGKSNVLESSEDCFGDRAKESSFDAVKDKKGLGRLKEKLNSTKSDNQVKSGAVVQDPPSDTGATLGAELIKEDWVCCDKCGTWRLLPAGVLVKHLPVKWICHMLNWLPGMNHCNISEDETTNALRALYQPPLPQNHTSGVPAVDQRFRSSFNSIGDGKEEAYKGKETVGPISRPKTSNKGNTNERKPYSGGSKPNDKLNGQRLSKPGTAVNSLPRGDAIAKKRVKRESDQDDLGTQRQSKSEVDNFRTPSPNRGRLANRKPRENDHSKQLTVDEKNVVLKSARDDGTGLASKKRKMMEWPDDSDNLEGDGSHTVSTKEASSDSGFVKDKRPQVSCSDGNESCRSKFTAELKSRMIPAVPKNIIDGNSDLKQQNMMKVKNVTLEDLVSLKRSLGCELMSTAVTSNSSKASDSHKTRSSYQELKGSPVMARKRKCSEMLKEEHTDKVVTGDVNHEDKPPVMAKKRKSPDQLKEEHAGRHFPETDASLVVTNSAVKRESRKLPDVTGEDIHPVEKERSSLKLGESFNMDAYTPLQQSLITISTQEDCRKEKSNVDRDKVLPVGIILAPATQNGSLLHGQAYGVSSCDVPKVSKDLSLALAQSESCQTMDNSVPVRPLLRDPGSQGWLRKNASSLTSHVLIKEAEAERAFADQIKGSGFALEHNETYFQASLKSLHGASLLESESEKNKSGELNQLQIYISAAKDFETCAHEYERQKDMALAALAYKCIEVAYMRVVYCKSSSSSRTWHDLQTSLQNVPLGESPSSSASDIDNLNNQAVLEKAPMSKTNGTLSGSLAIAPRTRPNFAHLLDFTKDVNLAMEASRQAQDAFAAAITLEDPPNKDGVAALKKVIDFSFQDVEEFVRLVRNAVESVESSRRPAIGLQ